MDILDWDGSVVTANGIASPQLGQSQSYQTVSFTISFKTDWFTRAFLVRASVHRTRIGHSLRSPLCRSVIVFEFFICFRIFPCLLENSVCAVDDSRNLSGNSRIPWRFRNESIYFHVIPKPPSAASCKKCFVYVSAAMIIFYRGSIRPEEYGPWDFRF